MQLSGILSRDSETGSESGSLYGQDTGEKRQKGFDEIGVCFQFMDLEKRMLHHLDEIDGIVTFHAERR